MARKASQSALVKWERIVAEYRASGMSKTKFAKDRGISLSSLCQWSIRLEAKSSASPNVRNMLPVKIVSPGRSSAVVITTKGGTRIEAMAETRADWVASVLVAMEQSYDS